MRQTQPKPIQTKQTEESKLAIGAPASYQSNLESRLGVKPLGQAQVTPSKIPRIAPSAASEMEKHLNNIQFTNY